MTNLPESIWADEGDDRVEYVRADIVTARIAAESEPQWQDGYNSARDDLDAEIAHISAREAKLAEIDAHRRKVIAENERQMNALIESSRRIAALEAQLAEARKALEPFAGDDAMCAVNSDYEIARTALERLNAMKGESDG